MQTGDGAGFGDQPKAAARRLLSRALWVGGLAVAGSVFGAASASATDAEQAEEPSGGLLGTLTATVEPVTGLAGSVADGTGKLLTDDRSLTEDLLGEDAVVGDVDVAGLVDQPVDEPAETGPAHDAEQKSATPELAAEREAAIDAHTDRSMRREPVDEAKGRDADSEPTTDDVAERGLVSLIGAVDRVLTKSSVVPEIAEVANVTGVAGAADELTSGATKGLFDRVASTAERPAPSAFSTRAITERLAAATGLVTLLDRPLAGGSPMLPALEPLRGALDPVVGAATPPPANTGAIAGDERREATASAPPGPAAVDHTTNTSADSAPRSSLDETGAARPAGQDGESAVIHSSLDAGMDGLDPFSGPRGGLRPSLLVTPVAGLSVLHVGAPGAATSADQAGPSSHALLPEEAVLRARLFSAAAYARNVEAKPQREANDPPVSPD